MSGLVLSVLPFALGAAVSPTLLTLELLILSGKTRPKARAWMFVVGASATLIAFGFLAATLLRNMGDSSGAPPNPWSVAIKAVLAAGLAALGVRQLRPRRTAAEAHHGRVSKRMASAPLPFFVGTGAVAMLVNFSTLVLVLPAIHLIVHSSDSEATKVTAAVVLFLVAVAPIVLPVLAVSVVGHRSDALLARTNRFTTTHSRQINAAICLFFAALLAYASVKEALG